MRGRPGPGEPVDGGPGSGASLTRIVLVSATPNPGRPFTRTAGLTCGLTARQLRGAGFVRLHRNVYVARDTPLTPRIRAQGLLLIAPPSAVMSHHTAAGLWGGTVPDSSRLHVTVPRSETFRVAGVRTHQSDRDRACTTAFGVRLTTPEQTFIDMASTLDLVQLVVLGDRLVRRQRTNPAQLVRSAHAWTGPHRSLACRAADLVRAGVDSPPESRLRMLVVLAGLPEPTVNLILRDPRTGEWQRRFELAYEELRLAVEYEGRQHREDEIWAQDIDRREELDRRSWRVVQVLDKGLYETPLRTLQRIEQARRDRGAAATRRFTDEWKPYFPGRTAA